jgi:hypothetical protein
MLVADLSAATAEELVKKIAAAIAHAATTVNEAGEQLLYSELHAADGYLAELARRAAEWEHPENALQVQKKYTQHVKKKLARRTAERDRYKLLADAAVRYTSADEDDIEDAAAHFRKLLAGYREA